MTEYFLIAGSLIAAVVVFYHVVKTKHPMYRCVKKTKMCGNGNVYDSYVVEQLYSVFGKQFWEMESPPDDYDNGSVFGSAEDAEHYIQSRIFKAKTEVSNVISAHDKDDVKLSFSRTKQT